MISSEFSVQKIQEMTDVSAHQWLKAYFTYIRNVPGLKLEVELLEKLGLGTFLKDIAVTPGLAKKVIDELSTSGQFPSEILTQLQEKALENAQRKRKRSVRLKKIWRTFRAGTKLFAAMEGVKTNSLNGSVLMVVGLWAVIDRMTADPDERQLMEFIALIRTLSELYGTQEISDGQATLQVIMLKIYGEENPLIDKDVIDNYGTLFSGLLNNGVPPHAIFSVLKRQLLHSPFHRNVTEAKQTVLDKIMADLKSAESIDTSWCTSVTVQERRDLRKRAIPASRPH